MNSLSASDLLQIWEWGEDQHPVERALTLLGVACPEMTRETINELSIGQRNSLLITLWELTLGPELEGCGECPQCHEHLEFNLNVADLKSNDPPEQLKSQLNFKAEGFDVYFRLLNNLDLAEAAKQMEVCGARDTLLARCLVKARHGDSEVVFESLPEAVTKELGNRVLEHDPVSEVQLHLLCPECGHRWLAILDIVSFFWTEISAEAKRLLYEVHRLARAYGWREADILAMSSRRRHLYLGMVN
jgi:hypothetical protein